MVELAKLPDGRVFPVYEGETLSWDPGLYMTIAEEAIGWPRARAVINAMAEHRPDQLLRLRRETLRGTFDSVFGSSAKRLLALIDLAPQQGTTAGPEQQRTLADALGKQRSATLGKLRDIRAGGDITLRLVPASNDPGRYDFETAVEHAGKRRTQRMGFRLERNDSLAKVLQHLQTYLDTDNPGRWKVIPSSVAPAAKRGGKKQTAAPGEHPDLAQLRTELTRLKGLRYKTGPQETLIPAYERRLEANPAKWNPGDGVGWRVTGKQINRGFRIVEVLHDNKKAVIRQVADTGLTHSGGDDPLVGPQVVWLGDLVRDRRYDITDRQRQFEEQHQFEAQQIERAQRMRREIEEAEQAEQAERTARAASERAHTRPAAHTPAQATTVFDYRIEYLDPGVRVDAATGEFKGETAEGQLSARNAAAALEATAEIAQRGPARIFVCPVGGSEYDCRFAILPKQQPRAGSVGIPWDIEQRLRELDRRIMEVQSEMGRTRSRQEWNEMARELDHLRARQTDMKRLGRPGGADSHPEHQQVATVMHQGAATREFESRVAWLQNWADRSGRELDATELYRELLPEFPTMTRYHYELAMRSLGRDPEAGMVPRIRDVGRPRPMMNTGGATSRPFRTPARI